MLVIITSDHGKLQTQLFKNFLNLPETHTSMTLTNKEDWMWSQRYIW